MQFFQWFHCIQRICHDDNIVSSSPMIFQARWRLCKAQFFSESNRTKSNHMMAWRYPQKRHCLGQVKHFQWRIICLFRWSSSSNEEFSANVSTPLGVIEPHHVWHHSRSAGTTSWMRRDFRSGRDDTTSPIFANLTVHIDTTNQADALKGWLHCIVIERTQWDGLSWNQARCNRDQNCKVCCYFRKRVRVREHRFPLTT